MQHLPNTCPRYVTNFDFSIATTDFGITSVRTMKHRPLMNYDTKYYEIDESVSIEDFELKDRVVSTGTVMKINIIFSF